MNRKQLFCLVSSNLANDLPIATEVSSSRLEEVKAPNNVVDAWRNVFYPAINLQPTNRVEGGDSAIDRVRPIVFDVPVLF
jgi:hypothetical protein